MNDYRLVTGRWHIPYPPRYPELFPHRSRHIWEADTKPITDRQHADSTNNRPRWTDSKLIYPHILVSVSVQCEQYLSETRYRLRLANPVSGMIEKIVKSSRLVLIGVKFQKEFSSWEMLARINNTNRNRPHEKVIVEMLRARSDITFFFFFFFFFFTYRGCAIRKIINVDLYTGCPQKGGILLRGSLLIRGNKTMKKKRKKNIWMVNFPTYSLKKLLYSLYFHSLGSDVSVSLLLEWISSEPDEISLAE